MNEVFIKNFDGENVFQLKFFNPADGAFTEGTNSTRDFNAGEIQAVTAAAQYWTDILKPRGAMPGLEDVDGNGQSQPVVINIGTEAVEQNAWGDPLAPDPNDPSVIENLNPNDPYLIVPSTAMLGDGVYVDPNDKNQDGQPDTTAAHGVFALGEGFNAPQTALSPTGRISDDVLSTAIHEFGHVLGISSSPEAVRFDEERQVWTYQFPQRLTRWDTHLRDNNGHSAVPGAYPNVDGKPMDYDPSQGGQYIFDIGDLNSPTQPARFTFVGDNALDVYYDGNEELIQEKRNAGEGVPLQGLTLNPLYGNPDYPDADRWEYNPGGTLSHIDTHNSLMSWQMYRNYPMFIEVELAALQDLGYDINRREFFGKSYYVDGNGETVYNNAGFGLWDGNEYNTGLPNLSAYGVGLHLFADNLNIVQTGDIQAGGPGAAGIRMDGVGNTLTIAYGTTVSAGLREGYKISENHIDAFRNYGVDVLDDGSLVNGVDGTGLLVSYGKEHHIVHRGTIIGNGTQGIGVRFDFGEPDVGARLGSYAYDPYYGSMEEENTVGGYPEELQGPLVKSFDVTGTIKGSRVSVGGPVIESKNYITITTSLAEGIDVPTDIDLILIAIPHDWRVTGGDDAIDAGIYGAHMTLEEPPSGIFGSDPIHLEQDEILVFVQGVLVQGEPYRIINKDDAVQDENGCWILDETLFDEILWELPENEERNDDYIPPQPQFSISETEGGTIHIAGSKYDPESGLTQGGAYVENINIMNGARIEGDIFSGYSDAEERTTTLTFGLKADTDGKATSSADSDFHFVYLDNIGYVFPYFEKAFNVLPHELVLFGNYEYINGIWERVEEGTGRFKLVDMPTVPNSGFDLHFAGGHTEFGARETLPTDVTTGDLPRANVSNANSIVVDAGATLELSGLRTVSPQTGKERKITRSLYAADSFINKGRLSGESGIWDGGGWIWQKGDPVGELGAIVYEPELVRNPETGEMEGVPGGWIGKKGGGIWVQGGKGTLINSGTIAPGPNNGHGFISDQRTGTLAIAGNLDLSSKDSVYEVTIADGRKTTATSPEWDTHPYWVIEQIAGLNGNVIEHISLEAPDPTSAWNVDPTTGLPVNDEKDIIGGGWGAGESDRLAVSGKTTLGGTLRIHVTPGDYSPEPTVYTIIQSEGGYTAGTNFENIEHYIGFLEFKPYVLNASNTYVNPNDGRKLQFSVIRDAEYFRKHGKTYNEFAAATAIDNSLSDSYQVAFSLADSRNSEADLRNMYHQIAGAVRANGLNINLWSPSEVLFPRIGWGNGQMDTGNRGKINWNRICGGSSKMLGQTPARKRVGSVWGEVMNTAFNAESDGNSDGYRFNRSGLMVGSEWSLTPHSAIGTIVSYHNSVLKQAGDQVDSDDYLLGAYFVAAPFSTFEFKSYIGLGMQEYDSDRRIYNANIITDRIPGSNGKTELLRGVSDRYVGNTGGNSFNFSWELARPFELHPTFILRPTLGMDIQHVWQSGYTENDFNEVSDAYGSNIYALRYSRAHHKRGLLRAGFSSETTGQRGGIRMRAFYVTQIAGERYPVSSSAFATGGERFNVRGVDVGENYLHLGVGAHYWFDGERTSSLFFDYDANIYNVSHRVNAHLASFGLLQTF